MSEYISVDIITCWVDSQLGEHFARGNFDVVIFVSLRLILRARLGLLFLLLFFFVNVFFQLLLVLLREALLDLFGGVTSVLGLSVAESVSNHEVLAILKQVGEAILSEVLEIFNVLFILAELVTHVDDQGARDKSKNNGLNVEHVVSDFEGCDGEEAVSGVVAVHEVVGE